MKRNQKQLQLISAAGILFVWVMAVFTLPAFSKVSGQVTSKPPVNDSFAVLELFTSQGCNSCPPADALLAEYAKSANTQVIPLSFHVDYWNRLGWTDPFSSRINSERQQWYSRYLPKGSVYTPQLVVNGRYEVVGNNRRDVNRLVQQELSLKQTGKLSTGKIEIGKNSLSFHYNSSGISGAAILNIALIQKEATTLVQAGENEGVKIVNRNIVRTFSVQTFAQEGDGSIALPPGFQTADYALVLYVQDKKSLAIKAVVSTALKQS